MDIKSALEPTGKAERHNGNEMYTITNEAGILVWCKNKTNLTDSGVTLGETLGNFWHPYHEKPEIRPKEVGELWKYEGVKFMTCLNDFTGNLFARSSESMKYKDIHMDEIGEMIHGQNGWARIRPPVPDENVERVEIEDVEWVKQGIIIYPQAPTYHGHSVLFNRFLKACPMKMILEIPKENP